MATVGTLEDQARKRKERLKNLRNKNEGIGKKDNDQESDTKDVEKLPK